MADTGGNYEQLPEDQPKSLEPKICRCCPFDIYPWLMLLCICFLTFGSYWVYDTPGTIQDQLTDYFGGEDKYSKSDNLLLYSVYSWPNTILAFFGGFIIDKITGVRLGALIFCFLVALGQMIFCIGIQYKTYWVLVLGRFVFGLGGESLTVAQNTYTIRWFEGKLLALAFGVVVAFSRIGSSVNFVVTPILTDISVPFATWFGMGMCGISAVAVLFAWALDSYGEARIVKKEASSDEISLRQVKDFPLTAWTLFLVCMFFYISYLTFNTVASDILQNTGAMYSANYASLLLSIPNFVAILMCPIFGRVVDTKGYSLNWILCACVMMIIAQFGFLCYAQEWFEIPPPVTLVWLGFTYSLGASSLWPVLSFCVEENMLGTAYGTMTSVQNFGLAVFPLAIGALQDRMGAPLKYSIPIIIFIGCAGVAFLLGFFLLGYDRTKNGGKMNASAIQRRLIVEREKQEKAEREKEINGFVGDEKPSAPASHTIGTDPEEGSTTRSEEGDEGLSSSYKRKTEHGL